MVFYLKVMGGADDGTSHRVDAGDILIGKAPTAKIQLRDESVAWEHAVIRDSGTRLVVSNLAAAGTKVRGKRITDETRIAAGDEIQLSHKVKLVVETRTGTTAVGGMSRTTLLMLVVVVLLLVGLGGALMFSSDSSGGKPPPSAGHWRQAYSRLCDRQEKWVEENRFPSTALEMFKDAWRYEQAGNVKKAGEYWNDLQKVLRSLQAPMTGGLSEKRITEASSPDPKALGIVMGWDTFTASTQFNWDSDEAMADALVWFVRKRAEVINAMSKD